MEKHENGLCWWNVDLAKETGKRLEKAEERERVTGSDHSRCFESITARMFGKAGEVVVVDLLGYEFPRRLAVLVDGDGSESGRCNVLDQVQTNSWTVCDAESMAQVTSSTEIRVCANGICAEDTRRCWSVSAVESGRTVSRVAERNCGGTAGREENVRPCGPSSGLQGNETARCEFVLDGLDCGNLEWKLHKRMLGNGDVEQSSDEPSIAARSAGISSHLHDDHGIGAERFDKTLDFTETGLETGRLYAGFDLLCGRCGVDCCIGVCCRNNGVRSDRKAERGWTDGWCTENTLDEISEDDGHEHHGGRIGCGVGGSFGVCGIDGVSGRECKTCDRTQNSSSHQMPCKMETCVEFPMAPQIVAVEHSKNCDVAGLPLELECLDDGQGTERQNCELERENGGECCWIKKKTPGMELGQWWRLWHRTGHRWIEKCNMNVLVAIRDRILSWAGHVARMDYKEICAKALRCRGLELWRWSQLHWKEVEKDKWAGPHPQRFKIYRLDDMVAGEVSKFVGNEDGLSKTVQDNTGWLHFAQKPWKLEAILEVWKEPCTDGPGCLGDPCATGTVGTDAGAYVLAVKGYGREWFGVHLVPLSLYQAKCDIALMSSWYSAGYDWPSSYGKRYGCRRGCWSGNAEVVWFCETCRMALQRCGTKVLSWNVAGGVFLSLVSNVGDLKPELQTFSVWESLILRPQFTDDLNDFTSARAAHMTVTNTWMNTHTHYTGGSHSPCCLV